MSGKSRLQNILPWGLLVILVLSPFVPELMAQQEPKKRQEIRSQNVIDQWVKELQKIDEALQAGEWLKAKKKTVQLLRVMCDQIQGGGGEARMIATATLLRSLAEIGLKNERSGYWDYLTALTLAPELAEKKFGLYGTPGRLMDSWQKAGPVRLDPGLAKDAEDIPALEAKGLQAPKKIHTPLPKYPFGKQYARVHGRCILSVIIDKEGIPTSPLLLAAPSPLMGFAALEAIKEWRFEPARLNGEPVEVYYNLTVNFAMQ